MRKILIFLFVTLFSASVYASEISGISQSSSLESPQVCQFSLTSYIGTIEYGNTGEFQVGLSCPQENDAKATVVVFIDGEHAASKVITVPAGKDYSNKEKIHVGASFNGQKYKLVVQ